MWTIETRPLHRSWGSERWNLEEIRFGQRTEARHGVRHRLPRMFMSKRLCWVELSIFRSWLQYGHSPLFWTFCVRSWIQYWCLLAVVCFGCLLGKDFDFRRWERICRRSNISTIALLSPVSLLMKLSLWRTRPLIAIKPYLRWVMFSELNSKIYVIFIRLKNSTALCCLSVTFCLFDLYFPFAVPSCLVSSDDRHPDPE